jgi:hypothetical protein
VHQRRIEGELVEKLTKVDKLVRTMMLTYPALYPDRATALFNIFTDSGTNYCWDEQGCIVQTYPSEKTWEGPIDISDLAKSDADWDRDDDFARTVRLENELERHQRLFRAEHIDLLCRYGRGGTYGYRHLNTYHLDDITAEWGCALIYRAPFGKIDAEWVRAMEEFIGDMMVAFNHVYRLHFDKPLRGEKAPEPSMYSQMPAAMQKRHDNLLQIDDMLDAQTGNRAKRAELAKRLVAEIKEETN